MALRKYRASFFVVSVSVTLAFIFLNDGTSEIECREKLTVGTFVDCTVEPRIPGTPHPDEALFHSISTPRK